MCVCVCVCVCVCSGYGLPPSCIKTMEWNFAKWKRSRMHVMLKLCRSRLVWGTCVIAYSRDKSEKNEDLFCRMFSCCTFHPEVHGVSIVLLSETLQNYFNMIISEEWQHTPRNYFPFRYIFINHVVIIFYYKTSYFQEAGTEMVRPILLWMQSLIRSALYQSTENL